MICTDVNTEIQDLEKLSSLDGVMGAYSYINYDGIVYIKYMCYATFRNKSTGNQAVSCLIEVLFPVDIITQE